MIRSVTTIAAAMLLALMTGANAQAQTEEAPDPAVLAEGAKLFKERTCFTCHGADAKTPILPDYPILAGQNEKYALQQMRDIKSGARNNGMTAAMKGVMHLVTDEELQKIAKYIASLPR